MRRRASSRWGEPCTYVRAHASQRYLTTRGTAMVRSGCGKILRFKKNLMKLPKCAHGQPRIDPCGSRPYVGGIPRHVQQTWTRAPRRGRVFGCARRALENGLENRTPIHCKVRFSKKNVAAGSGRSRQIAPASVPTMHTPESGTFSRAAGRQEVRVVRPAFCFSERKPQRKQCVWVPQVTARADP